MYCPDLMTMPHKGIMTQFKKLEQLKLSLNTKSATADQCTLKNTGSSAER